MCLAILLFPNVFLQSMPRIDFFFLFFKTEMIFAQHIERCSAGIQPEAMQTVYYVKSVYVPP